MTGPSITVFGRFWRKHSLTKLLSETEIEVLQDVATDENLPLPTPLTIDATILLIAMIGGYLNRKHDGPPGQTVLWRGYAYLAVAIDIYQRLSCLYWLYARIPVDFDLCSHENERKAALTHLPALSADCALTRIPHKGVKWRRGGDQGRGERSGERSCCLGWCTAPCACSSCISRFQTRCCGAVVTRSGRSHAVNPRSAPPGRPHRPTQDPRLCRRGLWRQ